jgi:DNA-binding beta-propeller fold protein YncE
MFNRYRWLAFPAKIDRLAVDAAGNRLFAVVPGNDSVEVIDLKGGKRIHSITGLQSPKGIAYVPRFDRLVVSNGTANGVDVFDGSSYRKTGSVAVGHVTDLVCLNPETMNVLVGYGSGIAFLTGYDDRPSVRHRTKLWGQPAAFQIDHARGLIYASVPSAKAVEVCDMTSEERVALWPASDGMGTAAMALVPEQNMLLVASQEPARLCLFDTKVGRRITSMPTLDDVKGIYHDSALDRVYVLGASGAVDVLQRGPGFTCRKLATISKAPGATAGIFVPALRRLFIAVPNQGSKPAEVQVYEPLP